MTSIAGLQRKIEELVKARDKLRLDVREAQHQADLARQEAEERRIAADKMRSEFQAQIDTLGAEIASRQTEFDTYEFFGSTRLDQADAGPRPRYPM
jgi:FtsZ-binding cell division protein ZapB